MEKVPSNTFDKGVDVVASHMYELIMYTNLVWWEHCAVVRTVVGVPRLNYGRLPPIVTRTFPYSEERDVLGKFVQSLPEADRNINSAMQLYCLQYTCDCTMCQMWKQGDPKERVEYVLRQALERNYLMQAQRNYNQFILNVKKGETTSDEDLELYEGEEEESVFDENENELCPSKPCPRNLDKIDPNYRGTVKLPRPEKNKHADENVAEN